MGAPPTNCLLRRAEARQSNDKFIWRHLEAKERGRREPAPYLESIQLAAERVDHRVIA